MKSKLKFYVALLIVFNMQYLINNNQLKAQIGIGTTTPDASAILELDSIGMGLLISRMTLAQRPASPATALLIYQTDNTPGYYYWDGAAWVRLFSSGTGGSAWELTGNAGTTVGTNFLGTTDAEDFAIYTNNAEVIRITQGGNVGIGTTSPVDLLQINDGAIRIRGAGNNAFVNPSADDFRVFVQDDLNNGNPYGTGHNHAVIFENQDATQADPDDGMFFFNTGNDNIPEIAMSILGNGNVGIGTVSPGKRLVLDDGGNDIDPSIEIIARRRGASYNNAAIVLAAPRSGTADGGTVGGRGMIVLPGQSGTTASSLYIGANTASMVPTASPSTIQGYQSQLEIHSGGYLNFWRLGANYARIHGNGDSYFNGGNVGIGTTGPNALLSLGTSIADSKLLIYDAGGTNTYGFGISFALLRIHSAGTTSHIGFFAGANGPERMKILGNGNVGIGTTFPSHQLQVEDSTANCRIFAITRGTGTTARVAVKSNDVTWDIRTREGDGSKFYIYQTGPGARLTIDNTGNVGIGTLTPGAKLEVAGRVKITGGTPAAGEVLTSDATGLATWEPPAGGADGDWTISGVDMYSAVSGNVGIGITTPAAKLQVNSDIKLGDGTTGGTITASTSDGSDNGWVQIGGGGTANDNSRGGGISMFGNEVSAFALNGKVLIDAGDHANGAIWFRTGTGVISTRMVILNSGNVGIGTTSPGTKLEILESTGRTTLRVKNTNSGAGGSDEDANLELVNSTRSWTVQSQTGGSFQINDNTAGVNRFRINTNGNVGIGTTAPTALLSVNGSANKPGGGSWTIFSDKRLKKEVKPFSDGLDLLMKINPVSFRYNGKAGIVVQDTYIGVIAQEMQEIAPYMIKTVKMKLDTSDAEPTDLLEFDPNALWYIMVNAIKELKTENEQLKAEITEIRSVIGMTTDY